MLSEGEALLLLHWKHQYARVCRDFFRAHEDVGLDEHGIRGERVKLLNGQVGLNVVFGVVWVDDLG